MEVKERKTNRKRNCVLLFRLMYVDCTPFYKSKRVDQLMTDLENLYTNILENGNRTKAMQRLRLPPLEEKQSPIVTFRLGIYLGKFISNKQNLDSFFEFQGMICILIPLTIYLFVKIESKETNWQTCIHLYRSLFLIIFEILFFGLNVYGWSTNGVNHVLIFEINPRKHLTYQQILEIGMFLFVCCLINFDIYLIFSSNIEPLVFVVFIVVFLLNPIDIYARQSRYWFIRKLSRVLTSPFHQVQFSDFWLGDQLCSLELVFFDIEYYVCFYLKYFNPNIICSDWLEVVIQCFLQNLPSWYRFSQCVRRYRIRKEKFPHLVNAGKYASSFIVNLTNALRRIKSFDYHHHKYENPFVYLWILSSLISSIYKLIWDIKMDWGLANFKQKEHRFLREQLIYSKKIYYYLSILFDFICRFLWIVNIFIHFQSLFGEYSDLIGFLFAFIELIRRFVWNYFRLENEHLNNCGQFRAVRDISIRPNLIQYEQFTNERPIARRKTNAEQFLDEINPVLSIQPTLQIVNDDSLL